MLRYVYTLWSLDKTLVETDIFLQSKWRFVEKLPLRRRSHKIAGTLSIEVSL